MRRGREVAWYDARMRTTDTDRLGDEIAELAAHLDAATDRLLTLIRQFDEAGGWADQGALSCAHWLSWRIGLELGAAREHVRVARALDDGTALGPATTDRLLCDAAVVEVVDDSRGNVLDVGRRRRTIPTLLRRALRLRDRGCRFPGCTNRHVDGHHVVPWARGGARRSRTCARSAGGTTRTSTSTASA